MAKCGNDSLLGKISNAAMAQAIVFAAYICGPHEDTTIPSLVMP
jgi:hypothetical protein